MSDTNELFLKSFYDAIFQLRNHPAQCKEAVDLLKTHMKYHPLDEVMLYEYMIVGFYAKENVDDIIVQALNNKKCRIQDCMLNYKFYDTTIRHLSTFQYTTKEGSYYSSTPCIIDCPEELKVKKPQARFLMNQRFVNYKIVNDNIYYYEQEPKHPLTFNRRLLLDDNFQIIDNVKLKGNLEDVRLFDYKGKVYFSSSFLGHRDDQWGVSICTGTYPLHHNGNSKGKEEAGGTEGAEDTEGTDDEIIEFDTLTTTKNQNVEKNWVYVKYKPESEQEEGLYLIYQWYPLVIGKINKEKHKTINIVGNEYGKTEQRDCYNLDFIDSVEMPYFFKDARGSTNCHQYRYRDIIENWFIVHIVSYEKPRHYYNVFAVFDEDLNLLRYSYPFKLSKCPIEYALGLIVNEETVIISYSTWDNTSNVSIYDKKYIDSLIRYT
jgi:hypothetical protein